jgi:hypothetical protein
MGSQFAGMVAEIQGKQIQSFLQLHSTYQVSSEQGGTWIPRIKKSRWSRVSDQQRNHDDHVLQELRARPGIRS